MNIHTLVMVGASFMLAILWLVFQVIMSRINKCPGAFNIKATQKIPLSFTLEVRRPHLALCEWRRYPSQRVSVMLLRRCPAAWRCPNENMYVCKRVAFSDSSCVTFNNMCTQKYACRSYDVRETTRNLVTVCENWRGRGALPKLCLWMEVVKPSLII